MNLQDRTALVVGGAQRVGRAISLALAQAGCRVGIGYHTSAASAEECVQEITAQNRPAFAHWCDVSDETAVKKLVAAVNEQFGAIDVLVFAASHWQATPFPSAHTAEWLKVLRILTEGAFFCANAVAPSMLARQSGAIIHLVDNSAFRPFAEFGAHSVGKSALLALTRQLAVELAPHIRVNAIAPGPVLPLPGRSQALIERVANRTLLKRWGSPQDVAQAVLYLLQADYITGACINLDGGELIAGG
ncbi:MAG TPA: SDR family oxidoreductase [Anaerolineales bacterium]|nr:SDR family oxidoreductase [Anaerolineales bacterium]